MLLRHLSHSLVILVMCSLTALFPTSAFGVGATIIIHGWHTSSSTTEPTWTAAMQNAIDSEWLGSEGRLGTITVTGTAGNLTATCNPWNLDLGSSSTGEVVVRVDWHQVADHLISGVSAQQVAAVIAPKIYQAQGAVPALSELPIHLIGHSRGGGMICELARLLGEQGVVVDQLSPLDPHPLTAAGDPQQSPPVPPVVDTPVAVYENVYFVDTYWQNISYPQGQYVPGALNREWTSLPGGYHDEPSYTSIGDHLNVTLVYHGSVDLATPTDDGTATLEAAERSAWYNSYETGSIGGDHTGFYYSRIAGPADRMSSDTPVVGGDAVIDGVNNDPVFGGAGARSSLSWASATWPNLATIEIEKDGTPLGTGVQQVSPGDLIQIGWTGLDADSDDTITLTFDADRNPYNSNTLQTIATVSQTASAASYFQGSSTWDTSGVAPSSVGYIMAKISDGTHTRYLDAGPELHFEATDVIFEDGFETGDMSAWNH